MIKPLFPQMPVGKYYAVEVTSDEFTTNFPAVHEIGETETHFCIRCKDSHTLIPKQGHCLYITTRDCFAKTL